MDTLPVKALGLIELYTLPICIDIYKRAVNCGYTVSQIACEFSLQSVICSDIIAAMTEINNALVWENRK